MPDSWHFGLLSDYSASHVRRSDRNVWSEPPCNVSPEERFRCPYPRSPSSVRSLAVLSAVQRAIERQERLIALTAELKKALMHKLFTEGTRGEPLKQTEIGPVPESWTVEPLRSQLATLLIGTARQAEEVSDVLDADPRRSSTWREDHWKIDYSLLPRQRNGSRQAGLRPSLRRGSPRWTLLMADVRAGHHDVDAAAISASMPSRSGVRRDHATL